MRIPMQMAVSSDGSKADFYVMGDIYGGWRKLPEETSASEVTNVLNDLGDDVSEITVHINSYGGMVSEGVAIYNALKNHKAKVTTVCEGFACSIASVVFMAGDERVMRPASLLMLHNASMWVDGDANAHKKAAQDLETITELSKTAYLACASESLTEEKLTEVMDAETWVSPQTALEWGLATSISDDVAEDEPSQHAAMLVQQALLGGQTLTQLEEFDPAWEDRISERLSKIPEQIFARMDDLEALITRINASEVDEDASPTTEPDGATSLKENARRIFQKLSE